MSTLLSPEFLLTALVVAVTPGTGAILVMSAGLARGPRASIVAAVGSTLGALPHMAAAISGAALLVATSPVAFQTLKWAGVAYLLWMAVSTLRSRGSMAVDESGAADPTYLRTVTTAVGANLLNPKLTVFFFAFLPQFVPVGSQHATAQMLALSGIFLAMGLVVFVGYGLGAAALRDKVLGRPAVMRRLQRVFAVSFVALGVRLALTAH